MHGCVVHKNGSTTNHSLLSFSVSFSMSCFEMRILQVSCFFCFVLQGFLTSYHTRLLFWHTFLAFIILTPNGLLMLLQPCQNMAEGKESSQKLHPSLNFISRPCQGKKGTCFIFNNQRESPPSLRLVFLWRWSRAERENAVGKVLARSDLLAGGGVIPLSLGLSKIWAVRCLKEFDLQPEHSLSLFPLSPRGVFSRGKSRGSWSAGSLKR